MIKEKLKVLLEGLQVHLEEFKLHKSQPIGDSQQRTQKMKKMKEPIKGETAMMEAENKKLSQTISGLKGGRQKEETEA